MAPSPVSTIVDVRAIAPRERRALILSTLRTLAPGQVLELVDDHDPRPLHDQFQAEVPGTFAWDTLEQGPRTWRVAITRNAAPAAVSDRCCGACGACGGGSSTLS